MSYKKLKINKGWTKLGRKGRLPEVPIGHTRIVERNNRKYVMIKTSEGFIFEHSFVMELKLGRKLLKGECIHHINNNGLDNSISNLVLTDVHQHTSFHQGMRGSYGFKHLK